MLGSIFQNRTLTLAAITALSFLLIGAFAPGYLALSTVRIIVVNGLVLMTLSVGVMGVILTRSIDVSVGSTLALSAAVLGTLLRQGVSLGIAIPAAILTGMACGLFNGVLVALIRIPAIIATLGTLGLFRGIMLIGTGGKWIEDLPNSLKTMADPVVAGLPILSFVVLAILVVAAWFLSGTRIGRFIYAVGDNADAADHIGLPVTAIRLGTFVAAGGLAGLAGVIFAAQIGFIPTNAGNGTELRAIAACVLGGVSLLGGSGSVGGVVTAVFFLTSVDSALIFLKIPGYWNDLIAGLMLLAILLLDGRVRAGFDRSIRARRYQARRDVVGPAPGTNASSKVEGLL